MAKALRGPKSGKPAGAEADPIDETATVAPAAPAGGGATQPSGAAAPPPSGVAAAQPYGTAATPSYGVAAARPSDLAAAPPSDVAAAPSYGAAATPSYGVAATQQYGVAAVPPSDVAATRQPGVTAMRSSGIAAVQPSGVAATRESGVAAAPPSGAAAALASGVAAAQPSGATATRAPGAAPLASGAAVALASGVAATRAPGVAARQPVPPQAAAADIEDEDEDLADAAEEADAEEEDDATAAVPAAAAEPTDARRAAFRWYLDEITDAGIAGWIIRTSEPSNRCAVLLKEGGRLLGRALASQFRADLLTAGLGDGQCSFTLPMPRSLLDGDEHFLEIVEEETGVALTDRPLLWRSGAGTAAPALTGIGMELRGPGLDGPAARPVAEAPRVLARAEYDAVLPASAPGRRTAVSGKPGARAAAAVKTRMLFDISDLVYYIGHHPNLTGIQRVQSSIVLTMINGAVLQQSSVIFLSFNARSRRWTAVPTGFLINLLQDLFLPEPQRVVSFPAEEARYGHLPGAKEFDGTGVLDDGVPSVLCLLGAAWVQRDYFHRILSFKRRFGTRFVMMVHDLIPIYARETCDQGTARVFEEFLRRAMRHVDHYLSVSENTARDLRRYIAAQSLPEPSITVTRNGSSFDEFLAPDNGLKKTTTEDIPERFVLFVATIEGRKNHQLMLDVWRRLVADGEDPPHLVCIGRVGWRSERFVAEMVESNYLDGKIMLLQDISDAHLQLLYDQCLFTVCPSLYEGWGLPVGESLAAGKICVLSDRASLPEVAGEFGVYIDIDNAEQSFTVIRELIRDDAARERQEAKIRRGYKPVTWREVATAIVNACTAASATEWQDPYPYAAIPYAAEISFAYLGREADATFGDGLLNRIVDTRRGFFLSESLQELSFLRGEDARSAGIWAEPENWGTWLCQAAGDIVLGLAPNESLFYYMFLRLRASGPAAGLSLRLLANGEAVWEGSIGDRPRSVVLRMRKRVRSGASGWWQLKLRAETNLSTDVRNRIAAVDGRVPTIGFERLVLVPENDIKTRLDVITNFLL